MPKHKFSVLFMSSSIRIVVGVSVLLLLLFRKGVPNRVRGVGGKERVWIVAYLCRYSTRKTHRCVFCWKVTHPIAQFRSFFVLFFFPISCNWFLFSLFASPQFSFRSAATCIHRCSAGLFFYLILFMCEKLVVFRCCCFFFVRKANVGEMVDWIVSVCN